MQPYLSEIRVFAFGQAPRGWLPCNGQTLPINQYQALFSLLGTNYGGNGTTTFQLPNLQGSAPVGQGISVGGYPMGGKAGTENVSLLPANLPIHNHLVNAQTGNATIALGGGTPAQLAVPVIPATPNDNINFYTNSNTSLIPLEPRTVTQTGGSTPHTNMQPFNVVNLCICTSGIFPSRN
jgi:microcystin-dependent protein